MKTTFEVCSFEVCRGGTKAMAAQGCTQEMPGSGLKDKNDRHSVNPALERKSPQYKLEATRLIMADST